MKIILKIWLLSLLLVSVACTTTTSGNFNKREPDLKKAAELNVQLGSGYISQGKLKYAKEKLEKAIQQDPDNALAYSTMAVLQEKIGKTEQADTYYTKALELDSDNADIHNNYGTFLCNQNHFDEASIHFEIAINNAFYNTPQLALTNAGNCAMKNAKYDKAEQYFRRALQKDAKSLVTLYSMGELGLESKKYLMARAYMQRFHALTQPSPKSLWIQIQAEIALDDRAEAKRLADKLRSTFPDSEEVKKLRGIR